MMDVNTIHWARVAASNWAAAAAVRPAVAVAAVTTICIWCIAVLSSMWSIAAASLGQGQQHLQQFPMLAINSNTVWLARRRALQVWWKRVKVVAMRKMIRKLVTVIVAVCDWLIDLLLCGQQTNVKHAEKRLNYNNNHTYKQSHLDYGSAPTTRTTSQHHTQSTHNTHIRAHTQIDMEHTHTHLHIVFELIFCFCPCFVCTFIMYFLFSLCPNFNLLSFVHLSCIILGCFLFLLLFTHSRTLHILLSLSHILLLDNTNWQIDKGSLPR